MRKYKTSFDERGLQFHLENNVYPVLTKRTVEGILDLVERFNKGELSLQDKIPTGVTGSGIETTDFTIADMFEDLKIDIEIDGEDGGDI